MASISKNVSIDKLDDIVNKMKPVDERSNTYIYCNKKLMIKILNLELVILFKHQNIKKKLAKSYIPIWSVEVLWLKKIKNVL